MANFRPIDKSNQWCPTRLRLDGQGTLQGQIHRSVRGAVAAGSLAPGTRLPSTRRLAEDLGIPRTTTQLAFDQLLTEGYVITRPGAGTFVAPQLPTVAAPPARSVPRPAMARPPRLSALGQRLQAGGAGYPFAALDALTPAPFEFLYGLPDRDAFPLEIWRRLATREAREATTRALAYAPPEGQPQLRRALADHLAQARGMRCDPEQIVVVAGLAQGLALMSRVLLDPGSPVVIEEPGYLGARMAFAAEGAVPIPIPVDAQGMQTAQLHGVRARLAYVTPSHQFPRGSVLSAARRMELLAWARRVGAWVLEDDYDGELRYTGRPVEALWSLDADERVIYGGTFSKSLFPSLRLGFLVLPPAIVEPVRALKWLSDWSCPALPQLTLARFIAEDHLERHVRRSRVRFRARREALHDAVERHLGPEAVLEGTATGMHALLALPRLPVAATMRMCAEARRLGVGVYPAAPFYLSESARAELVLGYSLLTPDGIGLGIERLARAYAIAMRGS